MKIISSEMKNFSPKVKNSEEASALYERETTTTRGRDDITSVVVKVVVVERVTVGLTGDGGALKLEGEEGGSWWHRRGENTTSTIGDCGLQEVGGFAYTCIWSGK